jgi:hypothetical protein
MQLLELLQKPKIRIGENQMCEENCHCDGSCDCQHGDCGCDCGCDQPHFQRRYKTKAEQIAELEGYLGDLKTELQAVEERLADLRK